MKVIVCGAGQVGFNIARYLASEKNDVTVIDQRPDLVGRISDSLDVKGMLGFASHPDVLERAGAADADMVVAVTFADEVNMVACQVCHSLFNVPTKIARIRNQSYLNPIWRDLFSREHMPIDVIISPEVEVARAMIRRLQVPGAIDVIPFADGKVMVIGTHLSADCPVVDTPLRQLTELFPDLAIFVVGIIRNETMIVPTGDDHLLPGDDIYFVAEAGHMARALAAFGHEEKEARRFIIVGGGNIGLFLARELEEHYPDVNLKIIEIDADRARFAADSLSRSVVLNGDALDREVLEEANVAATETIVTVSNDDEVNILSALLAKRYGAQRAMALINNMSYGPLVGSLGIDVVVSPRDVTVSTILQHVRRGRIRAVHSLREGRAEVVEAEALDTSPLVGTPLRDAKLPPGIVVGAIVRGDTVIIPRGDSVIRANDRVVIFAASGLVKKVEKMFSVRLEFF
jgi:trk system potassium uptake protein TrkA